ncbi:MAG: hypothetical protein JO181_10450 [Solirubrobacterales bacterium]|nr:hypothetical protein [Solirubrobacterales bacterium]
MVGGYFALPSPALPAARLGDPGQIPVFLRVHVPANGSIELVFDSTSVEMVGLKVGATPGLTLVQLLSNDFRLEDGGGSPVDANVSLSAEKVTGMITGTARLSAGATVTALGEPPQNITNGAFSIKPEFGSGAPAAAVAVSPPRVRAGGAVRVHGTVTICPPGDRLDLTSRAFSHRHRFDGLPAVFASVRHDAYSVRTTVPKRDAAGVYPVTARCGGHVLGSTRLTVTPAPRR